MLLFCRELFACFDRLFFFVSGSNDNSRKSVRCYICGEDFAPHFISVHERHCKRRWDTGVTNADSIKKGTSLGSISAVRETEKGKQKEDGVASSMRKAQSVANISSSVPKQAWNARIRDKGSKENLSKEKSQRRPTKTKRKERPRSAYLASSSSQNLNGSLFSPREFNVYNDIDDADKNITNILSEKAMSLQDLSSNVVEKEKRKTDGNPKFMECQYCFKMFSVHSIHIHEKKCLSRPGTTTPDATRPKKSSRPNGRCVSVNELRTAKPEDDWRTENVLDHSLAISMDNLDAHKPAHNSDNSRFLFCSYCSKPFGSKSLPIHLPQCQRKYELEKAKKQKPQMSNKKSSKANHASSVNGYPDRCAVRTTQVSKGTRSNEHTPSSASRSSAKLSATPLSKSATSSSGPASSTNSLDSQETPRSTRTPRSGSKAPLAGSAYVACRFCHNYYGSASVKIHEAKCETKMTKSKEDRMQSKAVGRHLGRLFGVQR